MAHYKLKPILAAVYLQVVIWQPYQINSSIRFVPNYDIYRFYTKYVDLRGYMTLDSSCSLTPIIKCVYSIDVKRKYLFLKNGSFIGIGISRKEKLRKEIF